MTDTEKVNFRAVAVAIITAGAVVLAYGTVGWLFNIFTTVNFVLPSMKIIGGLTVISLGYIVLLLDLIRKK